MAVVDATDNADLLAMGPALADMQLVTAGSGVAIGLAQNVGIRPDGRASRLPAATGTRAIVSGSCSTATNAQVADFKSRGGAALAVEPLQLLDNLDRTVRAVLAWAEPLLARGPVLVYATAAPEAVKAVQARLGVERAGALVEEALSAIARGLVERGVGQLVVAGGETSGACVQALDITRMRIGPQIAPGVPWCHAHTPHAASAGIHLALKSGNFGAEDFFTQSFDLLR